METLLEFAKEARWVDPTTAEVEVSFLVMSLEYAMLSEVAHLRRLLSIWSNNTRFFNDANFLFDFSSNLIVKRLELGKSLENEMDNRIWYVTTFLFVLIGIACYIN